MQHQAEGRRVLDQVLEKLADVGKVERLPSMDGKKLTVLLMPLKVNKAKAGPKQPKAAAKPADAASPTA
jgi:translation initiation factor IF-3